MQRYNFFFIVGKETQKKAFSVFFMQKNAEKCKKMQKNAENCSIITARLGRCGDKNLSNFSILPSPKAQK
ncbi:MAG: hypothetical protein HUK17_01880 [Bacteroidales bacterium]|nr:hypothetical protein [Bacteroidales bacterium]